jgi:hypothetical protein
LTHVDRSIHHTPRVTLVANKYPIITGMITIFPGVQALKYGGQHAMAFHSPMLFIIVMHVMLTVSSSRPERGDFYNLSIIQLV